FRDRLLELSQLFDATNPDLSAFAARGGKLIIKGNGADYQRSVMQEITYYKAVVAKMGRARADQFIRFYVTPGVNHPGNGVMSSAPRCRPRSIFWAHWTVGWTPKRRPIRLCKSRRKPKRPSMSRRRVRCACTPL